MHDAEQIIAEYPVVWYLQLQIPRTINFGKGSKCKQIALTQILNW